MSETKVIMSFKDAPVGARFLLPTSDRIFVKIENIGNGLIAEWNGNIKCFQSFFSFVDKKNGIDFDTEIELI